MADGLEPVIARFLADTSEFVAPINAAIDEVQAGEERMLAAADAAAGGMVAAADRVIVGFDEMVAAARATASAVEASYAEMDTAAGAGAGAGGAGADAGAAAAAAEVEAANRAVIESAAQVEAAGSEVALAWQADYAKMAASTIALSDEMALTQAKVDASWAEMAAAEEAYDAKTATTLGLTKTQMLGIAAAAAVVAVATVKMAADFQTSTTRLVTSAGESAGALDQVQQGILSMAGQVGISASQLATGMYTVESAGYHGAAGLTVLKAAAQGARDEGANLTTVADAVSTALTDYHLPASAAATVTSQLVTAVGQGKTTMQAFADSLHSITPLAAAAHISLSDVAGTLAEMTDHGMSADQASQNLAQTLRTLLSPTASMRAELAQLGLTSTDLSNDLSSKGLQGTLESLSQAILTRMGPSGTLLLNAFNTSKTAADNFAEAIAKAPPAVQKLGQALADGTMSFAAYQKAIKALPADQYELATGFASMYNNANGFTTALKNGSPQAQDYIQALKAVTGNATSLNTALMVTGENAAGAQANIKAVASATTEAGGNVKGWAAIQDTLNQKLDEAKSSFGSLATEIGMKLLPAVSAIAGAFADAATWLSQHSAVAEALAVVIGSVLVGALVAATIAVWNFTVALLANPVVLIAMAIAAAAFLIIANWSSISGFFSDVWKSITGFFTDAARDIGDAIGFVTRIPGDVAKAFGSFATMLGHIAQDGWNGFTHGLSVAWSATLDFLKNLPREIGFALGFLAGLLVKLAIDGWNGFTHGLTVAFDATTAWFKALPGNILSFVADAGSWLVTSGHGLIDGLGRGITDAWTAVGNWFVALPGRVTGFLADAGSWLTKHGRELIDGMGGGIVGAYRDVVTWFQNLPGNIGGFFKDVGHWLWNAGHDLLMGLINGIESAVGAVWHAVTSFASSLVSGFKSALGIGSPSKVMAQEIGAWIPAGIAQGITDNLHHVTNAATATKNAALAALRGSASIGLSVVGSTGGLGGGAAFAGAGGPPVIVNVAGSIIDTKALFTAVQTGTLRYRNTNNQNGLMSTFRRPGG